MTRVFHDAGHPSRSNDRGIVWPEDGSGIIEKDWTLAYVLRLIEAFKHLHPDVVQMASRTTDEVLGLRDRAMLAHNFRADIAFSHHVNGMFHQRKAVSYEDDGSGDGATPILGELRPHLKGSGLMCFAREDDEIGIEVGAAVMRAAPACLQREEPETYIAKPNNWTRNTYNVLAPYGSTPAVLIEWGFATHPEDRAALLDPRLRTSLDAAMLAGIGRYIELVVE